MANHRIAPELRVHAIMHLMPPITGLSGRLVGLTPRPVQAFTAPINGFNYEQRKLKQCVRLNKCHAQYIPATEEPGRKFFIWLMLFR